MLDKLRNLKFLPLDLPPIPNKGKILSQFTKTSQFAWWDEEILLGDMHLGSPFGAPQPWKQSAQQKYKQLINYIETHLPFNSYVYVRLAMTKQNISPHVDGNQVHPHLKHHKSITKKLLEHQIRNEPCGYRFIIDGSKLSLYLCDKYDPDYKKKLNLTKIFVEIPSTTDFYVIPHVNQPHGVDLQKNENFRLTGFIMGYLNYKKHWEIINRSFSKYYHYCIKGKDLNYEAKDLNFNNL